MLDISHVDAVKLLHESDGILIDLGLGFRSGGIERKLVPTQMLSQCLCDLATAGVVHADKGDLRLFHFLTFLKMAMTSSFFSTLP